MASSSCRSLVLLACLATGAPAEDGFSLLPARSHVPVDTMLATFVAAGDLDGDGDLELLLLSTARPPFPLFNRGDGRFLDGAGFAFPPLLAGNLRCMLLGDADADGDADAIFGMFNLQNRLMLNDGNGFFADDPGAFAVPINRQLTCGAVGDFDGDGDPDVAVGGKGSGTAGALLNDAGLFRLSRGAFFPGISIDTTDLALVDFNAAAAQSPDRPDRGNHPVNRKQRGL